MCVIVHKPKKVKIDLITLEDIVDTNPDGLGYSYWIQKDNAWNTIKVLNPKTKDLKTALKNMDGTEAIIHARIATSGGVTLANVHPFIGKRYILFHNGIVSNLNGILNKYSDTRLLHKLIEQFPLKEASEMLKNIAHNSNSKFILVDEAGEVHRFGIFKEYKGLMCSNLLFNAPTYTYYDYWDKTNKSSFINNHKIDELSQDIKDKLKEKYGITEPDDIQIILEELDMYKLPITWENVQSIADYWYYGSEDMMSSSYL